MKKRKVALHVAYVGTNYRGLVFQNNLEPDATIEGVLEKAIHAMGGIQDSNFRDLAKSGWSRSSRTDKGVHSLASVVALKMECREDVFDGDPEGSSLAAAINEHLPAEIRVLAVQRVNNSFSGRAYCDQRSYSYYLPASLLVPEGADATHHELEARVQKLRDCLNYFEGNHPFHNYTKRKLYRADVNYSQRGTEAVSEDDASASDSDLDDEQSQPAGSRLADSATDYRSRPRPLLYQWLYSMDLKDRVNISHYRRILTATCSNPLVLSPGAQPCVHVTIVGTSFMLHQIRHMVGTAVAYARGHIPWGFVEASLSAPARTRMPFAPAEVLVLDGSVFRTFPSTTQVSQWSGDALALREQGLRAQREFAEEVLFPSLTQLMQAPAWDSFSSDLQRISYDSAAMDEFVATYAAWEVGRAARAAVKKEQREAATDAAFAQ
ncbi:hypothetical protein WJX72_000771 [[Myrmecia] bisecta]|uniref:Pseudouridine synthase I TruA alpha/beta domain-containing protein n=1 Tax=[Myrmecia] bisecta TaxID=41462 RepID=A0AAW1PKN3_9CHLO